MKTNQTPRLSLRLTAGLLALSLITACAAPNALSPRSAETPTHHVAPLSFDLKELDNPALRFKYRMDPLFAGVLLTVLSPLLLIIILAIKIEGILDPDARGSIFWKETRISRGKPFHIYKFRVLKASALSRMKPGESVWPYQQDREGNVTRVGRILLQAYLDERPQFIKVVRGAMSVVGPRPRAPATYETDLARGSIALRYLKGGITGPHQLFKGSVFQSPARSNDYYEKCRAYGTLELFLYDLGILWQTVFKLIKAEGL